MNTPTSNNEKSLKQCVKEVELHLRGMAQRSAERAKVLKEVSTYMRDDETFKDALPRLPEHLQQSLKDVFCELVKASNGEAS